MNRVITRKTPAKSDGFSWGRFPSIDSLGNCVGVQYRLFRRDQHGVSHMEQATFYRECDRQTIARQLKQLRRHLRDRVDEIALAAMGVAA
jgi:hypothetical protein